MNDARRHSSQERDEHVFTRPVTDRIEMEDGPGRRLSFSFSPASSWSMVLLLSWFTFLGPLFLGGILLPPILQIPYYQTSGPISIVVACFVVAGASGYWYWKRWLHTATVAVENGSIELTNTPFFTNGSTTTIPCDALDDVQVEQTHESNSEPVYALSLVQNPSRSTGPRSNQRNVWVAGGLDNKAEADWIADCIQEAAGQQATSA
jgi:hypothetical protein